MVPGVGGVSLIIYGVGCYVARLYILVVVWLVGGARLIECKALQPHVPRLRGTAECDVAIAL